MGRGVVTAPARRPKAPATRYSPDMDREANMFAAFLLMPNPAFRKAMDGIDLNDDQAVDRVAKQFRVTIPQLIYRLHLEDTPNA